MRDQLRLLVLCALHDETLGRIDFRLLARTAQTRQSLDGWFAGVIQERSPKAEKARRIIEWAASSKTAIPTAEQFVERQLEAAEAAGAKLTTVLDEDYPANLRLVPDAPPMLFYKGSLNPADARSVAVVGTRRASNDGLARARRMAQGLSANDIVVVSGLAKGIDTAAHGAITDMGKRTVAVLGAGVATKTYPPENAGLAGKIVDSGGAVVSQFWPTDRPDRWRFPARNITMSGYTQGTVVIEASSTSGAKMQAQAARAHAKTVFLLKSLAATQSWAADMLAEALADAYGTGSFAVGSFAHSARISEPQQMDLFADQHDPESDSAPRTLPLRVVEVADVEDVIERLAPAKAINAAGEFRHRMASSALAAM